MSLAKQNRIYWIDYAKGIGIFLVVIGHVGRGMKLSLILDPSVAKSIDLWIYAFHMPIFFFLSGLLIPSSVSKSLKTFLIDKLKTITYPYFVWSIIQGLLLSTTFKYANSSISLMDLLQIIYQPILVFWFLYILFIILIFYKIAHELKISPIHFFIFSIFLYGLQLLAFNFIPWGVFDLVCRYTIYFAIGAVISHKLIPSLNQSKVSTLLLVTISGFLAIAAMVWLNMVENQLLVPFIATIGVSSTIALAVLLERFKVASFIQQWGVLSLQIYVAHTIFTSGMRILLQKLVGTTEPFIHILLGTTAGIYAPIAIDWLCRQLKFPYLFTFRPNRSA